MTSRVLGLFFLAGAMLVLLSALLPHPKGVDAVGLFGIVGLAALVGSASLIWARHARTWTVHAVLAGGTALVCLCVYFSGVASGIYSAMFIWVVLVAASFFGSRAVAAHVGWVVVSWGLVLFLVEEPSGISPITQWALGSLVLGVAAAVMSEIVAGRNSTEVELRGTQGELEDAQRIKDEFMALISHELRTPLTSIVGYSELLLESSPEDLVASGKGFAEIISRNAARELRLVEDLLDLTQLDAGKFRVEIRDAKLSQIVSDSVESARLSAADKDIALSAAIEPMRSCPGDSLRLAQTCDNLISNAIKFTPEGGTVAVDLHLEGETAVLSVEDSGIGIREDELKEVFDRMFRTKKAEDVSGSGLGLAITKAIVDAHGGEISVESEEDKGSIFTMRMPMAPSPATT